MGSAGAVCLGQRFASPVTRLRYRHPIIVNLWEHRGNRRSYFSAMNNNGYVIYQAERTKTATEQREIDRSAGELAASVARRWQSLAALGKGKHPSSGWGRWGPVGPLRSRWPGWRGRPGRRPADSGA